MDLMHFGGSKIFSGVLAPSLTATGAWAGETEVTSPDAGPTAVARTDADGNQSQMEYTVIRDSANTVKFENAAVGLGEDGVIESDLFTIDVANAGDTIHVNTKAGKDTAEWVSGESDFDVDANGFRVELVSISGTTYTLRLSSTPDVDAALSHVAFSFYPGQMTDASYD